MKCNYCESTVTNLIHHRCYQQLLFFPQSCVFSVKELLQISPDVVTHVQKLAKEALNEKHAAQSVIDHWQWLVSNDYQSIIKSFLLDMKEAFENQIMNIEENLKRTRKNNSIKIKEIDEILKNLN